MKDKRFWILPGGIFLVSAAFLLLHFRVAVGNAQSMQMIMVAEQDPTGGHSLKRRSHG